MALFEVREVAKDRHQPPDVLTVTSFPYSEEFRERIVTYLQGMEAFPKHDQFVLDQLGGPESRLMNFVRYLVPEIEYRCGRLDTKRVLDFGCGTGSSTVALARR